MNVVGMTDAFSTNSVIRETRLLVCYLLMTTIVIVNISFNTTGPLYII